ncbi:hypothetical protein [Parasedimentitalea psychrophila]|uniref:Transposase n=1 Tax=Parasedimentitalea psychrophila TaxID=2997337 RepID=A0A9Y2KY88_9RHOB|nr:hypothetical protein [Parasedimentitalea psychrophila]WIY24231.1 hypothetical protein QPJ95_16735 [Parasedimentitalea psychrophila]
MQCMTYLLHGLTHVRRAASPKGPAQWPKRIGFLLSDASITCQPRGKWQGKERIQGGRACLRRAIYLPAVVAARLNADMKAKYHELVANGKCKKLAITAVMRKLVVMANGLLLDGQNGLNCKLDQYGYSSLANKRLPGKEIVRTDLRPSAI